MKSASIGTLAASRSHRDNGKRQAGFTLLEALVALALVLAFAATLGPHLSQARRIMDHAESRVAAQVLLRSLLDAPFDRSRLAKASRKRTDCDGASWLSRWSPLPLARRISRKWLPYLVIASVAWGSDQVMTAETIRLGWPER
jgi:prepilin-type N-terminal cleavage/methylation domain-containing protein